LQRTRNSFACNILHIRRKTPIINAGWIASKSINVKDILRVSVCIERILPMKKNAQANYA